MDVPDFADMSQAKYAGGQGERAKDHDGFWTDTNNSVADGKGQHGAGQIKHRHARCNLGNRHPFGLDDGV